MGGIAGGPCLSRGGGNKGRVRCDGNGGCGCYVLLRGGH